jgi:hypothetical protein
MRCGGVLLRHNSNNRDDKDKDKLAVVDWMICYFRILCIASPPPQQNKVISETQKFCFKFGYINTLKLSIFSITQTTRASVIPHIHNKVQEQDKTYGPNERYTPPC